MRTASKPAHWSSAQRTLGGALGHALGVPVPPPEADPAGADWDEVLELGRRHRVLPLLQRSSWAATYASPELAARVARAARSSAARVLERAALQRDLLAALSAEGIDALVLKGLPVAQEAYGDLAARGPGDLDLLVAPERAAQAGAVLTAAGFAAATPPPWLHPRTADDLLRDASRLPAVKDVPFRRGKQLVELHWRLTTNRRLLPLDPRWLTAPRRIEVASGQVPVLPLEPLWWHLHVHGAEHEWRRLKWLADVVALPRRHPELLAPAALERLEAAGLARPAASSLLLGEELFGAFLPDDARGWAAGIGGARRGVDRARRAVASEAGAPPVGVAARTLPRLARARFGLRRDRAYRREEARRLLLDAGRAQAVPDPGAAVLVTAPLRWAARGGRD